MIEHLKQFYLIYIIIFLIIVVITLLINYLKKIKTNNQEIVKEIKEKVENIAKIEEEKIKTSIDEVIENLENAPARNLNSYEQDQEENAIISYQELVEAVKGKVIEVDTLSKPEPTENIDSLKEVLSEVSKNPVDVISENDIGRKKFKNSEVISPVFGVDKKTEDDTFLETLKNFRKNL